MHQETNRDILATRLATQGYDLCHATGGEEALDTAKAVLPDWRCACVTT